MILLFNTSSYSFKWVDLDGWMGILGKQVLTNFFVCSKLE